MAVFTFRYRSRGDIQTEGHIERSPSPTPLEQLDPEDLTLEETRELVRRARESNDSSVKVEVKREKREWPTNVISDKDKSDDGDASITAEGSRHKQTRIGGVEVFDLTED